MRLDTDTMTAQDRVLAVVNHEQPDRVPTYLMGMPAYADFYQEFLAREDDPTLGFEAFTEDPANLKFTPLGDLTVPYFFGQECVGMRADIKGQFNQWIDKDGNFVDHWDVHEQGPGRQVTYYGRLEGVESLPNGSLYTWYIDGWLKRKEDLIAWFDQYGWPHEHDILGIDVGVADKFRSRWGKDFSLHFNIGGAGLYEKSWFMMGQARFMYYARKDPEFLLRVINSVKQMQLNLVDDLKRAKPEIIYCSDDMGQKGRPLMSPAFYKKYISPARQEVFNKIHEETGAKVIMHSCGNIVELLPALIEDGLDGWQSMEPASEVDHADVKKKYGDALCFWGGIDSSREMCFGNPASVREHVKNQIAALGKGGGYVAGPAHDYLNVSVANALAMRDAILEFGQCN